MLINKGNSVHWEGCDLAVKAEYVPRYLYTTASINVHVNANCILRTGGVWRLWGKQGADFVHNEKKHHAELSWRSGRSEFEYELTIDGQRVLKSVVTPRNFLMPLIPIALLLAVLILFEHFNR